MLVSYVDFVIQQVLIAGQAAEAPVVFRSFKNGHFQILRRNAEIFLHAFKQQPDELFLGFDAPAFKHTELDDGVAIGAARRVEKIGAVQREKAMRAFIGWVLKRVHDAGVNDVGELPFDGIKVFSQAVDFYLGHRT